MGVAGFWQIRPDWLTKDRSSWPVSQDFTRNVPQEERRIQVFTVVRKDAINLNRLKGTLNYSHSLEKVQGIIACLLKMMFSKQVAKSKLSSR